MFHQFFFFLLVAASSLLGQSNPAPPAQFEVRGTLVDSVSGRHLSGADVTLTSSDRREEPAQRKTDDEGNFLFSVLKPGKYMLTAKRYGYISQAFDAHDGFFTAVVVGTGLDSSHVLFTMAPECSITGTVVDEAGEPIQEAKILLYQTSRTGGMEQAKNRAGAETNDLGAFHFSHLPPGRYFVSVLARVWYAQRPPVKEAGTITYSGVSTGYFANLFGGPQTADESSVDAIHSLSLDVAYPLTFYPDATEPSSAALINLKPGEKFVADINLQPVPALHLTIPGLGAKANNYPQLERKLGADSAPVTAEMRTDPSGTIEVVGLAPGQYTMKYMVPDDAQRDMALAVNAMYSGQVSPQQVSGANVTIALPETAAELRGQKRFLQLTNQKTNESFAESIPEKGDVELKKAIPTGAYELSIGNSGSMYIQSITAVGAKVSGRTIEIKGSSGVKLNASFAQGKGEISGTVMSHERPFGSAMVLLVPRDPGNNGVLFRRDQSNSDGSFRLPEAIPGAYTVVAIEKGWELEWRNPDVLKPYIAGGIPIEVKPDGKYDLKVNLQ